MVATSNIMGATEGVIMAIIMTSHISMVSARSSDVHPPRCGMAIKDGHAPPTSP